MSPKPAPRRVRTFAVPKLPLSLHISGVLMIAVLASFLVGWRLQQPTWNETLIVGTVIGLLLWLYFTVILYRRVRFDHGRISWAKPKVDDEAIKELRDQVLSNLPSPQVDLGEGCVPYIIGLVVFLLVVAFLPWLIAWGVEIGSLLVFAIAIPLYWMFRFSARLVIVHAARCNGDLPRSLLIGLFYAFTYAAVIGVIFHLLNSWLGSQHQR